MPHAIVSGRHAATRAAIRSLDVKRLNLMQAMYTNEAFLLVSTAFGVMLATSGDVMVTESGLADSMLLAWCLAGSVGAAACSVFMWPALTQRESLGIFIGNALFGLVFGPAVVDNFCPKYNLEVSMANALAISGVLSFAVSTGIRLLGPIAAKKLVSWADTADWAAFVVRVFGIKTAIVNPIIPPAPVTPAPPVLPTPTNLDK